MLWEADDAEMFSQSKTLLKNHVKQTRTMLSHPKRFFLSHWLAVSHALDSIFTGPCPVTADWRERKTTWGLLISCPWVNGWSLWLVCPAGASGQDSKIVLGWWTGKGSLGTFVMWDWETTIRSCHYSLKFFKILITRVQAVLFYNWCLTYESFVLF